MKTLRLIMVFFFAIYGTLFAQETEMPIKKFNVKVGYANFNFTDPSLVGDNSFFYQSGTGTGSYNAYRGLNGIYVKLSYYLNNNLGLFTDVALTNKDAEYYVDPILYKTNSDMNFIKLGLTGQIIGQEYPIRLNIGTGLGLAMYSFDFNSTNDGGGGTYLAGKDNYPGFFVNAELAVPIYKFIHFFSQFEYIYVPVSELTMEHDGGEDYYFRYYDANVGGFMIKLGLGFDIF